MYNLVLPYSGLLGGNFVWCFAPNRLLVSLNLVINSNVMMCDPFTAAYMYFPILVQSLAVCSPYFPLFFLSSALQTWTSIFHFTASLAFLPFFSDNDDLGGSLINKTGLKKQW